VVDRSIIVVLALVLPCGASIPARADWQYTKWGMSPEEVLSQSNGNARRVPEAEIARLSPYSRDLVSFVRAAYVANGEKFVVSFQFGKNTKRLQRVDLDAADAANCSAYKFSLLDKFGSPIFKSADEKLLIWRDPPSGDAITWSYLPPSVCEIRFSPIENDFARASIIGRRTR